MAKQSGYIALCRTSRAPLHLPACSNAARVSGSVDSVTPDGLLVALQPPVLPAAVVGADGSFSFPSVPLGDYHF